MAVRTLKLGRERFVLLREKEYQALKERAGRVSTGRVSTRRKPARQSVQELGDIAEATRRLRDPTETPIPYARVRDELGLR